MDYQEAVSETWRHFGLTGAHGYANLVRYAILAASSHNTQPWRFRINGERISILPDLSRRCPAVDPDDHHLYASLGCAAENLLLAARAAGRATEHSYAPSSSAIQVKLKQASPSRSALFEAIPRRHCCRAEYDGSALSREQAALLEKAGRGRGVSVILLTTREQKEQIAEYAAEGNVAQLGNPAWVRELKTWIRFNARDALRARDGLYARVMGQPDVPHWLGRLVMGFTFSAKSQNRSDVPRIRSAGAVAVFFSNADDKAHWVEAGRCCQRFLLQAAALNLQSAFINQPVEVPRLRSQFAEWLGIGDRRPDLVVRVGRGPDMPYSLRRPLEHVLV